MYEKIKQKVFFKFRKAFRKTNYILENISFSITYNRILIRKY